MTRTEFEALRDLPGKKILDDIKFVERRPTAPLLVADDIPIENEHGIDARMSLTFNPDIPSLNINVHVLGVGPICRVDANGAPHRPAGRHHKHALQGEHCPRRNLPDGVVDMPELAGKTVRQLFERFCLMASIEHLGTFEAPDEQEAL